MVAAAPALAAHFLDVQLPGEEVFADVQRLVRNLIAMNEILRDRERATIRLVMNPDRMVIMEAQRTFTYLNLYGYLTDAVVVNRIFPDDSATDTSGPGANASRSTCELVARASPRCRCSRRRYFEEEVIGARDARPARRGAVQGATGGRGVLHTELAQRAASVDGQTVLRMRVPFSERGERGAEEVGRS